MANGVWNKASRLLSESPQWAGVKRAVLETAFRALRGWNALGRAGTPAALCRPEHLPSLCGRPVAGDAPGPFSAASATKHSGERGPCAVVLVVHNGLDSLRPCLRGLADSRGQTRVILVDDESDQPTARFIDAFVSEHDGFELRRPQWPLGTMRSLNAGIKAAGEADIILLDCRTLLAPGCLDALADCARRAPGAGIVTPLSNTATQAWIRPRPGESFLETSSRLAQTPPDRPVPVAFPDEGCLYVCREVCEAIGGLDEAFTEPAYAFLDFAVRAREAGYETVCCTCAYAFHPAPPFAINTQDAQRLRERAGPSLPETAYDAALDAFRRSVCPATSGPGSLPGVCREEARWHYHETFSVLVREPGFNADMHAYRERLDTFLGRRPARPQRPRIVFLLNRLQRGGGVISVAQLINDLILLGVDARLVVHSPRSFDPEIPLLTEPLFFRGRSELVTHFPQADIVVGTFWNTMYAVAKVFLDRGNFVPAYFVQDFEPAFIPESQPELREACKKTYALTPFAFAKTPWICGKVRGCGGTIALVPPAIDLDLFYPRDLSPTPGLKRVLTMLRPSTPRRGFHTALAVFNRLAQERSDFEVHSFGSTDSELAHYTIKFPLINHGRVPNHQLPYLYSRAWCFAEFSSFHGFGRTVAEAFACGTPALATESGGTEFFCRPDINCLTARPGDVDALCAQLAKLLDDEGTRARLATRCRESVAGFDRLESARETLRVLMSAFE